MSEHKYLPTLKFTALCNGVPIAWSMQALMLDGMNYFTLSVIGNSRYTSNATLFQVQARNVQWIRENDLAIVEATFTIEGMLVGDPTRFLVQMSDYPQAPLGLLHWTRLNQVWNLREPTGVYERFSLLVEQP